MKIIYLSHILNIHDYRFLEKLSASNHDVLLVAVDNSNIPESISSIDGLKHVVIPRPFPMHDYKYYFSFISIIIALRHYLYRVIEKLDFHKKLFNKRTLYSHEEFRFLFYRKKLSQIIKKFKPDVIHAGWIQLDGLVAALTGFKPVLQMPWGSDILIHPFKDEQTMCQTKYVLEHASHIYCDCDEVKKTILDISDFEPGHFSVFPQLGIDLSLFNPKRTKTSILKNLEWEGKRIIIMTRSFLNQIYGNNFFIMALPKILHTHPDTRVIMVGTGPDEEVIKEIVDSLDLSQFVYFTGFVPNEELAYYLNAAEIYISTSKSDGTSLSLLEAMACKLPVVVSDVPANCEWIQDGINGFIVPRSKVNPISDKINNLLSDKSLAEKMGKLNYNIAVEKANLDINFSKLEKTYQNLSIRNIRQTI
jgi:glycosyltransferase involved in cell wall biosynthesis